MRVNSQVTSLESEVGRGGSGVAITVMDSRCRAAVLGMTRTMLLGCFRVPVAERIFWICDTVTPAQMLISNLLARASAMSGAERISDTDWGLQARMMTEAASAPRTFSFCRIERAWCGT